MSEMVERCIDALLSEVPLGYGMTSAEARKYVRTVIATLRSPTGEMVRAGADSFAGADDRAAYAYAVSVDDMSDIWSAMIDEALKP